MNKNRVLIIDDEPDICMLLSGMLKSMGYETHHALNLTDGYSKYQSLNPPVVFCDLTLPDGSGFSLLNRIKEENPDTKIIMISAHDSDKERRTAQEKGASFFIGKPLNRNLVQQAVNEVQRFVA